MFSLLHDFANLNFHLDYQFHNVQVGLLCVFCFKVYQVTLGVFINNMELAEWLVHWAPKLASRVRCSARSSP